MKTIPESNPIINPLFKEFAFESTSSFIEIKFVVISSVVDWICVVNCCAVKNYSKILWNYQFRIFNKEIKKFELFEN